MSTKFNLVITTTNYETNEETTTSLPFNGSTQHGVVNWADSMVLGLHESSTPDWEEEDGVMFAQISYVDHNGDEFVMTLQIEEA